MGATDVRGAVVLITGSAGALGSEVARRLAYRGAVLALADRDAVGLARLAAELAGLTKVATFEVDLLDDTQLARLPDEVTGELGPVDMFISSAGVEINAALDRVSTQEIDVQLGLHLRGPMLLARALVAGMRKRRRGHIVIVSSMSGKVPQPAKTVYAAAKAGSVAFAHALRRELDGTGIQVSVVVPGVVTGAGQAHRALQGSTADPARIGAVSVDRCVDAILHALDGGHPEIRVTAKPTAILVALQAAWPKAADRLLDKTGVGRFWLDVAREQGRA